MRNLHSHTYRCKHASGDAVEYVSHALKTGVDTYGISDHTPLPGDRFNSHRMAMSELDDYHRAIKEAQHAFPDISVLAGLECEDFDDCRSFYEDEILGRRNFDYLIGAGHFTPLQGFWEDSYFGMTSAAKLRAYGDHLCAMMESPLYAFIAHPDVFGLSSGHWNENLKACSLDILAAAEVNETPLEINGGGFRKLAQKSGKETHPGFPLRQFWEAASDYRITVVCNSDAHHPADAMASIEECIHFAEELGLTIATDEELGIKPA
tara:strand:+ start:2498 stop:3289 length:792 start_codon:yes stop_codon:yes gene_type:complete